MGINFLKQNKATSLVLGLLVCILSWFEFYIIYPVIITINSLKFSNIFEGLLLMIKFAFKFIANNVNIKVSYVWLFILGLLVLSSVISVLVLLILMGINNFVDGIKVSKIRLSKKKFLKIWGIVLIISLLIIIGMIALCVVVLPALLVTSSCMNGNIGCVQCIFFDIITFVVILSTFIYIQIPIWNALKTAILGKAEKVTDNKFKRLVIAFAVFNVIFVLIRIIMVPLRINFNGTVGVICQFLAFIIINFIYGVYKLCNIFAILKNKGEANN